MKNERMKIIILNILIVSAMIGVTYLVYRVDKQKASIEIPMVKQEK